MLEYKSALSRSIGTQGNSTNPGENMVEEIAQKVIDGFERVLKEPPRLPKELRDSVYHWLALMPGFKNGGDQQNAELLAKLCSDKQAKGLL
jgi:predicted DCC family thiol-disulfide oxidoreductase YuxK